MILEQSKIGDDELQFDIMLSKKKSNDNSYSMDVTEMELKEEGLPKILK